MAIDVERAFLNIIIVKICIYVLWNVCQKTVIDLLFISYYTKLINFSDRGIVTRFNNCVAKVSNPEDCV